MLQAPPPRPARAGSLLRMRLSELSAGEQEHLPGAQAVVCSCRASVHQPGVAELQALTACRVNPPDSGGIVHAVHSGDLWTA